MFVGNVASAGCIESEDSVQAVKKKCRVAMVRRKLSNNHHPRIPPRRTRADWMSIHGKASSGLYPLDMNMYSAGVQLDIKKAIMNAACGKRQTTNNKTREHNGTQRELV